MTTPFGQTRVPQYECAACAAPGDENRACARHHELLVRLAVVLRETLSTHPAFTPSYLRDRLARLLAADVARWLWQTDRDHPPAPQPARSPASCTP